MYGKFLVEGDKPVRELLASPFKTDAVFSVSGWQLPVEKHTWQHVKVTEEELRKISTLENPKEVVAVAEIPVRNLTGTAETITGLTLCLDNLNDPGNAGTIIRIADWFGIKQVFLSNNSVDVYNPKVVGAAKGSLFRVNCIYTNLQELFTCFPNAPVLGAFMNGDNIYKTGLPQTAFLIIGNEANGISEELLPHITQRIAIPSYGSAESLNAGVATGIIVSEWKRREV
ncbi:MAG: RNA methyltransferase [Chitinophagales bacterium]|nr:RNA methyltransferase [Chitinophagales bacterium]